MFKRVIIIIILVAVLLSAFFSLTFALFIRQHYTVPIIMYHSVRPDASSGNRLAVSTKAFQRQMHFLKTHRYNVLPLESVANLIREGQKIPPKTLAITFDDGYRDNYIYAFPVLKKYRLPATVFIIVNEIGRSQTDRLDWEEIKSMQDSGIISIGSHALDPEPLVKTKSEEEIKRQIYDSKRILEERLGKRVNAFSYPEGRFNDKIKEWVVNAGYQLAAATNPGKMFSDSDMFALKRLRISSTSDNLLVFWIETSGYYNFIRERRHK